MNVAVREGFLSICVIVASSSNKGAIFIRDTFSVLIQSSNNDSRTADVSHVCSIMVNRRKTWLAAIAVYRSILIHSSWDTDLEVVLTGTSCEADYDIFLGNFNVDVSNWQGSMSEHAYLQVLSWRVQI